MTGCLKRLPLGSLRLHNRIRLERGVIQLIVQYCHCNNDAWKLH